MAEDTEDNSMSVSQVDASPLKDWHADVQASQPKAEANLPDDNLSADDEKEAADKDAELTTDIEDFSSVCMPETGEDQSMVSKASYVIRIVI